MIIIKYVTFFQNENASLKKEISFFKNKLQNEEERHGQAAKTWQETEVALKAQVDQLTEREAQAKKSLEEMTNSTEGLKEQLKLIQVRNDIWYLYVLALRSYCFEYRN